MRKKKITSSSNLGIAVGFSFIVLGLIFLSFILRILLLLGDSKFDGVNSFTVVTNQEKEGQVINFSPQNQSISILNVRDREGQNLGMSLEIPIDGSFSSEEKVNGKNLSSILSRNIFNFKDQKELNFMDFLRLSLFTNTVKSTSIDEKTISKETSAQTLAILTSSFFVDSGILDEKQNIEIINATDVYGLGNKLANLVTNIGGNVILVTTGNLMESSEIQYVNDTYTAKRLSQILNFKLVKTKKKSIPDVIIIVGKDSISSLKF